MVCEYLAGMAASDTFELLQLGAVGIFSRIAYCFIFLAIPALIRSRRFVSLIVVRRALFNHLKRICYNKMNKG